MRAIGVLLFCVVVLAAIQIAYHVVDAQDDNNNKHILVTDDADAEAADPDQQLIVDDDINEDGIAKLISQNGDPCDSNLECQTRIHRKKLKMGGKKKTKVLPAERETPLTSDKRKDKVKPNQVSQSMLGRIQAGHRAAQWKPWRPQRQRHRGRSKQNNQKPPNTQWVYANETEIQTQKRDGRPSTEGKNARAPRLTKAERAAKRAQRAQRKAKKKRRQRARDELGFLKPKSNKGTHPRETGRHKRDLTDDDTQNIKERRKQRRLERKAKKEADQKEKANKMLEELEREEKEKEKKERKKQEKNQKIESRSQNQTSELQIGSKGAKKAERRRINKERHRKRDEKEKRKELKLKEEEKEEAEKIIRRRGYRKNRVDYTEGDGSGEPIEYARCNTTADCGEGSCCTHDHEVQMFVCKPYELPVNKGRECYTQCDCAGVYRCWAEREDIKDVIKRYRDESGPKNSAERKFINKALMDAIQVPARKMLLFLKDHGLLVKGRCHADNERSQHEHPVF